MPRMTAEREATERPTRFRTILADPPWQYDNTFSGRAVGAATQYPTLDMEALCGLPVRDVAAKNCALFLWCTWPHDEDGLRLIRAWGFEPKTAIPWIKMSEAGVPRRGIGWHHHSCSEFLRIAVKGSLTPAVEDRLKAVIFCPIGRHSAKPDAQFDFCEAYGGPYLEMFARPDGGLFPDRDNWTRIGNEIDGLDITDALRRLAKGEL